MKRATFASMHKNQLFFGDNLDVLRRYIKDETVDLIYLDPPFNSRQDYNVLFKEKDGTQSASQITAFEDTWEWTKETVHTYETLVESGGRVADVMRAFRLFLPGSDMLAYLTMMAPRLLELRRVLKSTGSIYLHCDPTASHYLKVLMDAIFGPENFRNEIVWRRTGSHNSARRNGPIHDTILFFSKTKAYYWNRSYRPYTKGYVNAFFTHSDEKGRFRSQTLTGSGRRNKESGKPWKNYDPTLKGRHWAFPKALTEELGLEGMGLHEKLDYLEQNNCLAATVDGLPEYRQYLHLSKGVAFQDIWAFQPFTQGLLEGSNEAYDEDVRWLERGSKERLGYPTQKPEGILERILVSSCPPRGCVLDPFCGCGTSIVASQTLSRNWTGIDITYLSIDQVKRSLADRHKLFAGQDYEIIGEPVSVPDAAELAKQDAFQFQAWALGLVGARTAHSSKRGSDKGIDGRLYFHDDKSGETKQIILSVKSGHVQAAYIRDLRGVIERERAEMGVLITLEEPSKPMRKEATEAGLYKSPAYEKGFDRIQIFTIEQLLTGEGIEYPRLADVTFKKAPKVKGAVAEQLGLDV